MHCFFSSSQHEWWFFVPRYYLVIGLLFLFLSVASCGSVSDDNSSSKNTSSTTSTNSGDDSNNSPINEPLPTDPQSSNGTSFASVTYTLYIEMGAIHITPSDVTGNGAIDIPAWGYTTSIGNPGTIPGPVLESVEGRTITIKVINNHDRNHNFVIKGITSDQTAIPPGGSRTYTFTTSTAGVFLYTDTLDNNVNRSLGLYGGLVVRTADGSKRAWSNGPSYDFERLWVVSDLDKPNWTDIVLSGGNVNTDNYRPNYFLMNGMSGFHAMEDKVNTSLVGSPGDVYLIRVVNAGQYDQSLHFHSNHLKVISLGGYRIDPYIWQHVVNVKAGSTALLLFPIRFIGVFPMHVHTAQMETGNGVYLNGTAAMIFGQ